MDTETIRLLIILDLIFGILDACCVHPTLSPKRHQPHKSSHARPLPLLFILKQTTRFDVFILYAGSYILRVWQVAYLPAEEHSAKVQVVRDLDNFLVALDLIVAVI